MHVLVLLTYESVRQSLSDGFIGTLAPKMPTGLSWLILVFTLWLRGRGAWHSCRALTAVNSLATKHFLCSIPVPIPESESRTETKSSSLHQSRSHWVALVAWSSLITQVLPSSESSQGGMGGKGRGNKLVLPPTTMPSSPAAANVFCLAWQLRESFYLFIFYFVHNLRV